MTGRALFGLLVAITVAAQPAPFQTPPRHALTIDDVLATERFDRFDLSPDGEWVAAVILRGAGPGEVYGRNSYEIDPSRGDVWLISTRTGEKRALTNGAASAAGYWCATWSPDGRRLAMLSTQRDGDEPRGGDNVRLYVWDRATDKVTRLSNTAVMTQGRYGSGVDKLDLRGGADGRTNAHDCMGFENAPFLWLDNQRLLAATLPPGQVSGLIDQHGRPFREEARDAALLRDGSASTARAVGSGAAREPRDTNNSVILQVIDVPSRVATTLARVPTYPFRSDLTVSVAPDGKRLAVMATLGAIAPQAGREFPNREFDEWTVERRLGFLDITLGAPVRWVAMPAAGRYPLDLYGWSPDGTRVALRARADGYATAAPLFVATAVNGAVKQLGTGSVGDSESGAASQRRAPVLWVDRNRLLARVTDSAAKSPSDWWLVDLRGSPTNLTLGGDRASFPMGFLRTNDGRLIALAGDRLVRLDPARRALVAVTKLPGKAFPISPNPGLPVNDMLVAINGAIRSLRPDGTLSPPFQPPGMGIGIAGLHRDALLWSQADRNGAVLRTTPLGGGTTRELMRLDDFMWKSVAWGDTQLIDYVGADGTPLKAIAILPPDYQPGHRYPTLTWLYAGYMVQGIGDYWNDPFLAGIYNLQLYAARGYVVVVPSMPLPNRWTKGTVYDDVPKGVLPALDRLIAMGIADPDRLGVFGQSFGGYSVYAILSQTDRFKAGVAIAGISNLVSNYGTFDPTARGYPGIEHEKSENWSIGQVGNLPPPPDEAARYAANSPLTYVDKIVTPLLLVHGGFDSRGASGQAEEMFTALYRRGRTARLLRYGGENHSLALSPANVRDVYARTIAWFDTYLKK